MRSFCLYLSRLLACIALVLLYAGAAHAQMTCNAKGEECYFKGQQPPTCNPKGECLWKGQLGEQCGIFGKKNGKDYFLECAVGFECRKESNNSAKEICKRFLGVRVDPSSVPYTNDKGEAPGKMTQSDKYGRSKSNDCAVCKTDADCEKPNICASMSPQYDRRPGAMPTNKRCYVPGFMTCPGS